jgi:hypothetical protein
MVECKICTQKCNNIFKATILEKYEVQYFQCESCSFIQTETPHWLDEAYSNAITSLDIGLISRNISFSDLLFPKIQKYFGAKSKYLDYGGGYGMFVRMMRDKGLNFYRQDIYCENLFAKHFDISDLENKNDFVLVTAFEVFEHLENPLQEIQKMFIHAPSILFSTIVQAKDTFKSKEDWWYFIPETGQHIALYSYKSLEVIAKHFGKQLYSNGSSLHLMTNKALPSKVLRKSLSKKILGRLYHDNYNSLQQSDFLMIKELLKQK